MVSWRQGGALGNSAAPPDEGNGLLCLRTSRPSPVCPQISCLTERAGNVAGNMVICLARLKPLTLRKGRQSAQSRAMARTPTETMAMAAHRTGAPQMAAATRRAMVPRKMEMALGPKLSAPTMTHPPGELLTTCWTAANRLAFIIYMQVWEAT